MSSQETLTAGAGSSGRYLDALDEVRGEMIIRGFAKALA